MPAYLATVPKQLPLECAIPNEAAQAMPMLEAIEQRGDRPGRAGRRPDRARPLLPPRAARGCSSSEQFDRVVVPATATGRTGSPATTWSGCWRRRRPRC